MVSILDGTDRISSRTKSTSRSQLTEKQTKTASAEAIAHELAKQIIVANYAEIQNRWVSRTEKNVVRVFRGAAEDGAVLFCDEADAMFYDLLTPPTTLTLTALGLVYYLGHGPPLEGGTP